MEMQTIKSRVTLSIRLMVGVLLSAWLPPGTQAAAEMDPMTQEAAIARAVESNPLLRASALRMRALEAEAVQAQLLPNPTLELEAENIAGNGEFSGTDAAEYTIMITQPVMTGGKRSRQKRVSGAILRSAERRHARTRRALIENVSTAFVALLEHREHLKLSGELVGLSKALVETTSKRVESGGASLLEQTKAEIVLATMLTKQDQVEQGLTTSRRRLATLLGVSVENLPPVSGDLYEIAAVPAFDDLKKRLSSNPEWMLLEAEREQGEAEVALADAQRIPEIELGVGWRRDEDAASDSFIFAAGMPIPVFDRGQGARQAARHALEATEAERRSGQLELEGEMATALSRLQQAHTLATSIKRRILPAANKAFEVSHEGYLQGRFGYIDLLDAQRTLFEARGQYVESLSAYHVAEAGLVRLAGTDEQFENRNNEE
jgi:cobalt-zinc-cadmium efflux system outer membrane protein